MPSATITSRPPSRTTRVFDVCSFRLLTIYCNILRRWCCGMLFRQPSHHVEFVVRAHRGDVGHPVRQREERGDRGYVPDVGIAETVVGDGREILLGDGLCRGAHLHREI